MKCHMAWKTYDELYCISNVIMFQFVCASIIKDLLSSGAVFIGSRVESVPHL